MLINQNDFNGGHSKNQAIAMLTLLRLHICHLLQQKIYTDPQNGGAGALAKRC